MITTLKQELSGVKTYEETSEDEKSVVFRHFNDAALKCSVNVKEQQDKLHFRCGVTFFIVIPVIYK